MVICVFQSLHVFQCFLVIYYRTMDGTCHPQEEVLVAMVEGPCAALVTPPQAVENMSDHDETYTCQYCLKTLATKAALKRHCRKHNNTMLKCFICERNFYDQHNLAEHIKVVHQGQRYQCDDCGKYYQTKVGLQRHAQSHTGQYTFKCTIRSRGFAYVHDFSDHVNMPHNLRPNICGRCHASFPRKKTLLFPCIDLWKKCSCRMRYLS